MTINTGFKWLLHNHILFNCLCSKLFYIDYYCFCVERYIDLVDYWSNVYGFKMSCMKAEALREPSIEICNVDDLITSIAEIQAFDLYKVTTDCVNFSSPFTLNVKKTGSLTAIIGYFDIFFDLDNPVHFSTGPYSTPTHWKQTVFSLSEPISITEGKLYVYLLQL